VLVSRKAPTFSVLVGILNPELLYSLFDRTTLAYVFIRANRYPSKYALSMSQRGKSIRLFSNTPLFNHAIQIKVMFESNGTLSPGSKNVIYVMLFSSHRLPYGYLVTTSLQSGMLVANVDLIDGKDDE
jgi:hypothetical protein